MQGRNDAKNPEESKTPPTGKYEIEHSGTEAKKHHRVRGLGRKIDREHEGRNPTGKTRRREIYNSGRGNAHESGGAVSIRGRRERNPAYPQFTSTRRSSKSKQASKHPGTRRRGIWWGKGGDETYQETARERGSEEEPSSRGGVGGDGDGESGRRRELGREERRRWRGAGRVWAVLRPCVPSASI
jgi:hypothetical protein